MSEKMNEGLKPFANILQHLLKTQDNRITSDVMFIVQQKEEIWRVDSDCHEVKAAYVKGEEVVYEGSKKFKTLDKMEDSYRDIGDWERVYYIERWAFVTACLTEEGAKHYIECNRHNLNSPRIYGWSGYRNQEWCDLREFFLNYDAQIAAAKREVASFIKVQAKTFYLCDKEGNLNKSFEAYLDSLIAETKEDK